MPNPIMKRNAIEALLDKISITFIRPHGSLVAFGTLLWDGWLLSDIGIHLVKSDIFLTFPNKNLTNGKRLNVYHPVSKEVSEIVRQAFAKRFFELNKNQEPLRGFYDQHSTPIVQPHDTRIS